MKVDVKTLDGATMSAEWATHPVGSALHIAPAFVATAVDESSGVETTIEAHYKLHRGRYVITRIINRAIADDFNEDRLKHTAPQAIVQTAIPRCIALQLDDSPDAGWTTVADLTSLDGRIIPPWMAQAVVKRGVKDERWEVIEILYGTAALADLPPVKLIAAELDVPERTASDWIQKARAAGWLAGLSSNVGRPANG
ncbi:helix-turn-helix domain-containing protein [Microbacterium sp. QXD-8]|uniref:Helix-turn-helix domain-containing protein n=1 Tax=Microbacterium psychrotolerans TaxID=3068321 RepID=A0ABU0YW92_9MICO|nr:helix-turn-helix domain-containing protein [Microbacterium sp. QXD-8]MDQ7876589.1 helix-turn-helix domain-containing protein [Microbacterium sp. QXD-8]